MESIIINHGLIEEGQLKPISYDIRWKSSSSYLGIVLFVHGFKGFKDWGIWNMVADQFAEANYVFVKINLSHNGTTPSSLTDFADLEAFGSNNFSHEISDINRIIKALKQNIIALPSGVNDMNIHLIGHSKGGASSIVAATEIDQISKVITWAAIDDIAERYGQEEEEWKKNGVKYFANARTKQEMPVYYQIVEDIAENKDRFNLKKQLQSFTKPLLVCHGTNDSTVIVDAAYNLAKWHGKAEVQIVEGANHVFNGSHPYHSPQLPDAMNLVVKKTLEFITS